MSELKSVIGVIAIILIFAGYVPYIRDIIKGKTHPHAYTWFTLATTSAIVFALQLFANAGIGAYVTLAAVIVAYLVFALGLKYGKLDIIKSDTAFLILAIIAIGLWLVMKQPVLSIIMLCVVELLAFIPTIRKTWNKPYSETLSSYIVSTLRFGLAIIALEQYNVVTVLYPLTWMIVNGLFWLLLVVRHREIREDEIYS